MRRKSVFMAGMLALLLAFGLVLAGCSLDDDDGDGNKEPSPKSGTIKLTETETNVFTVTLTGFEFMADSADIIVNALTHHLEVDGEVTAEGTDSYNKAISYAENDITYSVVRTSDTVLTITMSQNNLDRGSGNVEWYFGSGKLKFDSEPFEFPQLNSFIQDLPEVLDNSLTVAEDSESVSFDIPKHEE
jgi:hypothetical protein